MDISSNDGFVVRVRALRAADESVDGLSTPPADSDGPRWQRSVVAVADEQVIGFATLTLNPATDSYFGDVTVSPSHRRRGIGTLLFTEVQQLADRRLPIVGRAMSSQPLRRQFAEHLGGSVLMHCPMPSIDPSSTVARRWADAQPLPEGYQTAPLADVPAEEVQEAWSAYYTWVHQPFGVIRSDALPGVWRGYRAGVDETLSHLCRDAEGQIVAFSLVSPEVWDGRTFVVAETVHQDQPLGVSVLQATLATSVRALARRGMSHVEIEGHSTDAHIPQVFETLPAGPSDPLDIYQFTPTYETAFSLSAE